METVQLTSVWSFPSLGDPSTQRNKNKTNLERTEWDESDTLNPIWMHEGNMEKIMQYQGVLFDTQVYFCKGGSLW